jgi:hypothetical protein
MGEKGAALADTVNVYVQGALDRHPCFLNASVQPIPIVWMAKPEVTPDDRAAVAAATPKRERESDRLGIG